MTMIEAEGLRKSFGKVRAVRSVDLTVPEGTICALLGPNGAGKTTVVRVLCTLTKQDGGTARVGQPELLEQLGGPGPRPPPAELPHQPENEQVLPAAQVIVDGRVLSG